MVVFALLFVSPAGHTQQSQSDLQLHLQWHEVQSSRDPHVHRDWWHDLDVETLRAYVYAGVDVNASNKRGWTALHSAARYNPDAAVLGMLISAGALVNARDKAGDTPLHWAAADNPNVDIVTALIESGANVHATDNFGWLPLHTAADRSANPDVIRTLVDAGSMRNKRAYFVLFRPRFLLKHNSNMSEDDKRVAMELLK